MLVTIDSTIQTHGQSIRSLGKLPSYGGGGGGGGCSSNLTSSCVHVYLHPQFHPLLSLSMGKCVEEDPAFFTRFVARQLLANLDNVVVQHPGLVLYALPADD